MYVDYRYYVQEYGGNILQPDFAFAERKAESFIRYLTFVNGDIFAQSDDRVKDAVCAAADVFYECEKQKRENAVAGRPGPVKSENTDGYSVSYVVSEKDGETFEQSVKRKAYEAVYEYLLPTGWLSRRVGCHCADECRYYDL